MAALAQGARIGRYEVLAKVGEGGMGEVYRARDTKLHRDVAIKVLPALFGRDPERLARFEREARTLAALNHPHVAQVYGVEELPAESGAPSAALVMEFVDGEDLAERIARAGAIPLDEALPIALQVAEALEAAHEQNIIHRDLKPANIKVRPDGQVKVLDFGLAKALAPVDPGSAPHALENSPTITSPFQLSQLGIILGTAAYMAPEQAKGKPVDKRADIWAFGCVLYEMLTGTRPFSGEDVTDTLAAIVRADPDWSLLPPDTPPTVRTLLRRCLEKDRRERLPDIGAARLDLKDARIAGDAGLPAAGPVRGSRAVLPWALLAAAAVGAAFTAAALWMTRPAPRSAAVVRFTQSLPEGQLFTGNVRRVIEISPDGSRIAYIANSQIYTRPLADPEATPLAGTAVGGGVRSPTFSPDGRELAFYAEAEETVKRIAATGGSPVTVCQSAPPGPSGISWGPNGLLFGLATGGIMLVPARGGTPAPVVSPKDNELAVNPQWLPDGEHILFTLLAGDPSSRNTSAISRFDSADIVVQRVGSAERKTVISGGSDARYVTSGHLVYALSGRLYAIRFDPGRLETSGQPIPVLEGVRRTGPAAEFSVSRNGTIVYIPGPATASDGSFNLLLATAKGAVDMLKVPAGPYVAPRASPDGKRIAFGVDNGKEAAVYIYDLSGARAMQRLTFGGGNRFPVWSPDGKDVAFQSDRGGTLAVWRQRADGTGTAEQLTRPAASETHVPEFWAENEMLIDVQAPRGGSSVSLLSLSDRKLTPIIPLGTTNPSDAVLSPDHRWIAYSNTDRALATVYVQPFPPTGAKYQLLAHGSDLPHHPRWSADGKLLYFNPRPGALEAVTVTTHPTFAFGEPYSVPKPMTLGPLTVRRPYDVMPDGRLLGVAAPGQGPGPNMAQKFTVVINWLDEMKQRIAAAQ